MMATCGYVAQGHQLFAINFKKCLVVLCLGFVGLSLGALTLNTALATPHPQTNCALCHQLKHSGLSVSVLKLALKAHTRALCDTPKQLRKAHLLTIIDYSLPSNQPRLWIIDLKQQQLLLHTWVSHGQQSGQLLAHTFSNQSGSHQSSLGVLITGTPYWGKHGCSLNLHGMEPNFNSNAYQRRIVLHGAAYAKPEFLARHGYLGRSWGCPAVNPQLAMPLIQLIRDGSLMFTYYPDTKWLQHSSYLSEVVPS
jgi:hypothetical protein